MCMKSLGALCITFLKSFVERERERERERESCLFVVGGPENVLYRELVFSEVREVICTLIFRLLKLKPDLNV